jgi:NAD(P)H-hydrate epimerase
MKLLTPLQMKTIDQTAIERIGIPGIVLMENAALQVVAKATSMLKGRGNPITVIAGAGNNGGDAFAVTRHLLSLGYSISCYGMIPLEQYTGDAYTNGMILKNMGLHIPVISDDQALERLAQSCRQSDLVIDGLFGTGLNREVEGLWSRVIDVVNENAPLVLSIDIASGVDGLTGKIMGNCIRADATVTFFLPKLGMAQYPGAACMGEVTVADIGIPYALAEGLDTPVLLEKEEMAQLLPFRPRDGHKGTFGRILMLAGSAGMTGAAYLSASAAYRMGTGLVKLALPQSCMGTLAQLIPEAVLAGLPERDGHSTLMDGEVLKELIDKSDALLIGPGLSCNDDTHALVKQVVECCEKPVVFDADALNILAQDKTLLDNLRCEAIITPHPAEMARLAGMTAAEVQADRLKIARQFADEYGLTVVLKGAGTVIAANDGRVSINSTGNEGMATAGSGDVLAGMVVSLLGQGLLPYDAARAGAFYHGLAGDLAAGEMGTSSLMATDILAHIAAALK